MESEDTVGIGQPAMPETERVIEIQGMSQTAAGDPPAGAAAPKHHALNDDLASTKTPQERNVHTDGELLVDSVYAEAGYIRIRAHYEKSGEAVDAVISIEEALNRYVGLGVAYKLKAEKAESGMWKDSRDRLLRTIKLLEDAIKAARVQQAAIAEQQPTPRIIVPDIPQATPSGLIIP